MPRSPASTRTLACALAFLALGPSVHAQTLGLNITRGGSDPAYLVNRGTTFWFSAATDSGFAILRYDTVTDEKSAIDTPFFLRTPTDLTIVGGNRLFFSAEGTTLYEGSELWVTDGTVTTRLEIRPVDDRDPLITQTVSLNGLLVFVADDGVHDEEI